MTVERLPDWPAIARRAAAAVPTTSIDATWRALNYLVAAQLYLRDNPLLSRPLHPEDIKEVPTGHWGVCPPVNLLLAHLGPLAAGAPVGAELMVIHGAGHAGPSALAHAYLTGALGVAYPEFRQSAAGLHRLVNRFPHPDHLGSEVTPMLPGQVYMGGQLGAALPFGHGAAMDAPHRLVVPLIGDGECETGATAAAWLAARALIGTGKHGIVLPVILLNGLRMGSPSLLHSLTTQQLGAHLAGLGYQTYLAPGDDHEQVRSALSAAIDAARPLHHGPSSVVICTLPKGHTGPQQIGDRHVAGTPSVHKTPLRDPRHDPDEFDALRHWLAAYRPTELLDADGRPTADIRAALPPLPLGAVSDRARPRAKSVPNGQAGDFASQVSPLLDERIRTGELRVFCPDELASNRLAAIGAGDPGMVVEVLNEEICHAWAQGYLETGRQALVITYEAFAPVAASLLVQHLKTRRLAARSTGTSSPSIVYLVTSLGWNNSYTHQNPGLASILLATEDPTVHVFTPADAARAAASLDHALGTTGQCVVVVASKHPMPSYPSSTISQELRYGFAVWDQLSDPGSPDLVLAAAGDIPARELSAAAAILRTNRPDVRLRFVAVHDITALGDPAAWPLALSPEDFTAVFGRDCPVLLAVPFLRDTARSLLWSRPDVSRFHIVGYRDPGRPLTPATLLKHCGMDAASLAATADQLLVATARSGEETSQPCSVLSTTP